MQWLNVILQGVLIGGLYALFAAGLSLIFGVMRLVNIAHGDLIVLAAYVSLMVTQAFGMDPLTSLLLVVPVMALIGYGLQRGLLNRTLGDDLLPPLLVTFGLSIIIQNGLLELFTADSRKLQAGAIEIQTFQIAQNLWIGALPLIQFTVAVAVIGGLQLLFYRTALGRALRATSDDQAVAQLMGLDTRHVFAVAMALSLAVIAIAGVFLAVRANFDPAIGPARLIFAFEAVIIGGLGSMWGTLAGGIILGVSQAIGAQIDPGWQLLAGHIVFLDKHTTGDGIVSALLVLDALAEAGTTLDHATADMAMYPQILINVAVKERFDVTRHNGIQQIVADAERDLDDAGRVLLRPSGTEPVIRVMVEGKTHTKVKRWAETIAEAVRSAK